MSSRKPSLKLIVYATPLIFLLLTFSAIFNHTFYTNTLHLYVAVRGGDHHRLDCGVPDNLIRNLEPLIAAEPLDVWEGLGKEEKNIKYLSSSIDLTLTADGRRRRRFIYVDVGARDYDSSIGSWFMKQYPKQNKTFEIYAVEADAAFHGEYMQRRRGSVTLLPYAAWVRNETVAFGSKPIVVKGKVWRRRPFGRIEAAAEGMPEAARVAAFDFVEWLKTTARPEDFVVVKMDVEGAEIELMTALIERGAVCLIDELFMECHFDRYVKCCEGERINRFNFSYDQCYALFKKLRNMGCVVHQWW